MDNTIDYTEQYQCVKAEGRGKNFLALIELDPKIKRFDGRLTDYQLSDLTLSVSCENSNDGAYACVKYDDYSFWTKDELKELFENDTSLFDFFNLF